jgi:protein-L-isoaspartate O-methyltransferase
LSEFDERREQLAEAMAAGGDWPERSSWIREAVDALPRHHFAPERLWRWDGDAYLPVDRGTDPEGWAAEVYGGPYDAAVTQVTGGVPSSSLSCQSVVVDMLDALMLEPGQRVLELGTGTGWNAALLAWRAGAGRVVSVEVDEGLAAAARERVDGVVVGDGAAGWPGGAPFDRVIATYAVDEVPWPWVAQTRPGGRIVTPWGRLGHVALTVAEDGRSASGWMQGLATFMPARGSDPERGWWQVRGEDPPCAERPVKRDLWATLRQRAPAVRPADRAARRADHHRHGRRERRDGVAARRRRVVGRAGRAGRPRRVRRASGRGARPVGRGGAGMGRLA